MGGSVRQQAFIALGSNLGDRGRNIRDAIQRIGEIPETRVVRESSFYESEPHGDAKTWFLNGVLEIETEQSPEKLLKRLLAIEKDLGRKRHRGKRWGSRPIDLDILFYENLIVSKRNLKIPHPEMKKRKFVLLPLSELAPQFIHPVEQASVSDLLVAVEDEKRIRLTPLRA